MHRAVFILAIALAALLYGAPSFAALGHDASLVARRATPVATASMPQAADTDEPLQLGAPSDGFSLPQTLFTPLRASAPAQALRLVAVAARPPGVSRRLLHHASPPAGDGDPA